MHHKGQMVSKTYSKATPNYCSECRIYYSDSRIPGRVIFRGVDTRVVTKFYGKEEEDFEYAKVI